MAVYSEIDSLKLMIKAYSSKQGLANAKKNRIDVNTNLKKWKDRLKQIEG
jgi:hypothetical protein